MDNQAYNPEKNKGIIYLTILKWKITFLDAKPISNPFPIVFPSLFICTIGALVPTCSRLIFRQVFHYLIYSRISLGAITSMLFTVIRHQSLP